MSGGSMDYLYEKITNDLKFELNTPERKAFFSHMQKIINALRDIELVDSGDFGVGDDTESIMSCISSENVLETLIIEAKKIISDLENHIKKHENI